MSGRVFRLVAPVLVLAAAGALAVPAGSAAAISLGPCKKAKSQAFRCGKLKVPLDYAGATPGSLSLDVRVRRASGGAKRGTLVMLSGGPGQNDIAGADFPDYLAGLAPGWSIVEIDQRGTGAAALRCAGVDRLDLDVQDVPAAKVTAGYAQCAAELGAKRRFYTSIDSARDIDLLRSGAGARQDRDRRHLLRHLRLAGLCAAVPDPHRSPAARLGRAAGRRRSARPGRLRRRPARARRPVPWRALLRHHQRPLRPDRAAAEAAQAGRRWSASWSIRPAGPGPPGSAGRSSRRRCSTSTRPAISVPSCASSTRPPSRPVSTATPRRCCACARPASSSRSRASSATRCSRPRPAPRTSSPGRARIRSPVARWRCRSPWPRLPPGRSTPGAQGPPRRRSS